jgi:DNA-directed RNA polymerase specialized sigma24 family protein
VKYRLVLVLRDAKQLNIHETGRILGIFSASVKNQIAENAPKEA